MSSPRVIAAKNGDRKYQGKPCKTCGCTERYTTTAACVECAKKTSSENSRMIRQHLQEAKAGV